MTNNTPLPPSASPASTPPDPPVTDVLGIALDAAINGVCAAITNLAPDTQWPHDMSAVRNAMFAYTQALLDAVASLANSAPIPTTSTSRTLPPS